MANHPNVIAMDATNWQGVYLAGVVAGAMTETRPRSGLSSGAKAPILPTGSFMARAMPRIGTPLARPSCLSAQAAQVNSRSTDAATSAFAAAHDARHAFAVANGTGVEWGDGLLIGEGAQFNRVGADENGMADAQEGNVISGNGNDGTLIGGEANLVPGNNATIFQGMGQGKGDIDVHPDVWLPNQESFTKKYVDEEKTVTLSSNPYEGNQGFCVSKKFGEANKITDIADLGRPDVAKKMDSDGNGKGEMWIGAPGWASAK